MDCLNCLICKASAKELTPEKEGVHLDCPECGQYTVSGSMVRMFDVRELDIGKRKTGPEAPRRGITAANHL